jgi:hypothetical protein
MTKFIYDPKHDELENIGWQPPILDLHGRPLVNGCFVAPDHEKCARKFTAGRVFDVDEKTEPHLYAFVASDRRFRKARRSDLPKEEAA